MRCASPGPTIATRNPSEGSGLVIASRSRRAIGPGTFAAKTVQVALAIALFGCGAREPPPAVVIPASDPRLVLSDDSGDASGLDGLPPEVMARFEHQADIETVTPQYTHVIPPRQRTDGDPPLAQPVDDGTYIAANIFGGATIALSSVGLIGGIAELIESSSAGADSSATPIGIVLVDTAPHVLTLGIVTLAMNGGAHARAKARAAKVAEVPFVVPLPSGGVLGGVGGLF